MVLCSTTWRVTIAHQSLSSLTSTAARAPGTEPATSGCSASRIRLMDWGGRASSCSAAQSTRHTRSALSAKQTALARRMRSETVSHSRLSMDGRRSRLHTCAGSRISGTPWRRFARQVAVETGWYSSRLTSAATHLCTCQAVGVYVPRTRANTHIMSRFKPTSSPANSSTVTSCCHR